MVSSSPIESSPTRGPLRRAKHCAEINITHHRELLEILRRTVDVRSDIKQHRGISRSGREDGRQCRTIHAWDRAEHDLGRCHGGAGVAGRNESVSPAFAYHAQAHAHGVVTLGADCLHLVVHGDVFAGVDDFDGETGGRANAGAVRA